MVEAHGDFFSKDYNPSFRTSQVEVWVLQQGNLYLKIFYHKSIDGTVVRPESY